jgi:hypothetical protein
MKQVFDGNTINIMNYLHGEKILEVKYGKFFNKNNISH